MRNDGNWKAIKKIKRVNSPYCTKKTEVFVGFRCCGFNELISANIEINGLSAQGEQDTDHGGVDVGRGNFSLPTLSCLSIPINEQLPPKKRFT